MRKLLYRLTQTSLAILTISSLGGYETGAATFGQAIFNALKIVLVMCIIAKLHKKRAAKICDIKKITYLKYIIKNKICQDWGTQDGYI